MILKGREPYLEIQNIKINLELYWRKVLVLLSQKTFLFTYIPEKSDVGLAHR